MVRDLVSSGHEAIGYDLCASRDILDLPRLREAVRSCDAVVHSAALLGRPGESPEQIMEVNLQGTWNVLSAALEAGVRRIVFLSSVDVLGVFKGERAPDYLPLDSTHPCRPGTPYGISKRLAEVMCRLFSEAHGLPVVCLRPPGVWSVDTYSAIESARAERPEFEWDPFWEYGAFLDVRDLSSACLAALTCDVDRYVPLLVCSSDISTSGRTSRELVDMIFPDLDWRGGTEFEVDPYRALIDIEPAKRLLDWTPRHTWKAWRGECI